MKSKQYFISTTDGKIPVKGYPVVIPGYEQFSFFAHRPDGKGDASWNISEEITGLNVSPSSFPGGMSNSTRKGALAIVIERFKAMGRDFVLPRLQSAVKATLDTSMEVAT